jgi:signal transduction histidine kinase
MTNLVTALLDLARVDSRLEQVREPCDLLLIVRNVLTDLQGQAMAHDVDLHFKVEDQPDPVSGDPTQLHQAISNLVDNAIKYSPPGEQVQVALNVHDRNVVVKVRDAGPGIPAKDIPHIFDKFYRVRGEGSKGGAGLGLTLVRSIAEAHGGWVWVESEQREGSTFTLQLPLGNAEGADA